MRYAAPFVKGAFPGSIDLGVKLKPAGEGGEARRLVIPPGVFLLDLFNGEGPASSHRADTGHTLADASGFAGGDFSRLEVGNGHLRVNTPLTGAGVMWSAIPPAVDYWIEARVHAAHAPPFLFFALVMNYDDGSGDGYAVEFERSTATMLNVQFQTGAKNFGNAPATAGELFVVRIESRRGIHRVFVDDVPIVAGCDSSIAIPGKVFAYTRSADTGDPRTQGYFDYVMAGVRP